MNDQDTVETKKGFFQNDRLLVCSMLAFYGICILGLIGGTFGWLGKRNATLSVNATSTAFAIATQQANSTATAIVRSTEQAKFGFIERFDSNKNRWRVGQEDSEYWRGETKISGGVYTWDVEEVTKTFVSWADFPINNNMKNFHVYVDTKLLSERPGDVCGGFQFRMATDASDESTYYYALCNDSSVDVSYQTKTGEWERIATRYYSGYTNDWNRLEIIARDTHFLFLINGEQVYEMTDDRLASGGLALVIELNEKVPATVWFDNFGLQR